MKARGANAAREKSRANAAREGKTKRDSGKEWLLIKERDGWVRRGAEAEYPPESILSGLSALIILPIPIDAINDESRLGWPVEKWRTPKRVLRFEGKVRRERFLSLRKLELPNGCQADRLSRGQGD